jgi:predicted RNA binding protein YcfA (HicA-like mRNA interferase family)
MESHTDAGEDNIFIGAGSEPTLWLKCKPKCRPSFANLKPQEVIRALEKGRFYIHEQSGSHVQMKHPDQVLVWASDRSKPGDRTDPVRLMLPRPRQTRLMKKVAELAGRLL